MEQTPPETDVTLAMVDFAFGAPAQISAGPLMWNIRNFGEQWHHAGWNFTWLEKVARSCSWHTPY